MVWGCFSHSGVGLLYRVKGIMDRFQYRDILEKVMLPHAKRELPSDWIFQHDNDPKHTARVVKDWLGKEEVQTLQWPPQSPDLNPIENLWNEVKRLLHNQRYHSALELEKAVKHIWTSFTDVFLNALIDSMPRRCHAVIEAKGYATKY